MAGKKKAAARPKTPAKVAAPPDLAAAFRQTYVPPPPTGTAAVTLDPDVAPHFRDARAVNEALRALLRIVKQVRPV